MINNTLQMYTKANMYTIILIIFNHTRDVTAHVPTCINFVLNYIKINTIYVLYVH